MKFHDYLKFQPNERVDDRPEEICDPSLTAYPIHILLRRCTSFSIDDEKYYERIESNDLYVDSFADSVIMLL